MKKVLFAAVLGLLMTGAPALAAYQVGDTISDFSLRDGDGNLVSLYDYEGKVIFINFWGSG